MEKYVIDINCDVGEGIGNEEQLLPLISSCNIACGAHAGDARTARTVIRLAKSNGVKIGAHPSYPDRDNFGRKSMDISSEALIRSLREQLQWFNEIMIEEKAELNHIKAHGALYNDLAKNESLAITFIEAVRPFLAKASIYAPFGSELAKIAKENNIGVTYEAFADRSYNEDLSLVSRSKPNALISDPVKAFEQIKSIAVCEAVTSLSGKNIPLKAETFCIHGDTPAALQILTYLVRELPGQQIFLAK